MNKTKQQKREARAKKARSEARTHASKRVVRSVRGRLRGTQLTLVQLIQELRTFTTQLIDNQTKTEIALDIMARAVLGETLSADDLEVLREFKRPDEVVTEEPAVAGPGPDVQPGG